MKRPLDPHFELSINPDGSLDLRRNLAIMLCALHGERNGQAGSKCQLLDSCERVCNVTHVGQCRGNMMKSAREQKLQNPFIQITKKGRAKNYALTLHGQSLIGYAQIHPVRHLSELLRRLEHALMPA